MDDRPAVRARAITKRFGEVVALDGIDLDVAAGGVHGLVGPNGAGKTTLMGMLLGLASPDGGTLEILGTPVGRSLLVPDGVVGFVDGPGLYPALTARKNLRAFAMLRGYDDSRLAIDAALEQVGLVEVADDPVRGFSLGMRQRLGLAVALVGRPRVLVLDEPANGLDPAARHQVHEVIQELARGGTAIVVSSHRMDDLALICSEVTLLSTGRVVFSGPLAKLAAESGDLDYRLLTSDTVRAATIAGAIRGLRVLAAATPAGRDEALVVRGGVEAVDELVAALVSGGVAVRELAPVVPPLEAAFLALTGAASAGRADRAEAR